MRIIKDFKSFTDGGGLGKKLSTVLFNPNFHSVCLFRLSNLFFHLKLTPVAKIVWYVNRLLFHVDIDYRADLAGGFVLVHGLGTVIGKNVISRGTLKVYQHVTLGGGNGKPPRMDEDGKLRGMPLFLGDATVYTGAIVVGGIIIADGAIIKAGEIVSNDII